VTNAEARFNNSLRPRKPEGSLGRTAQDVHLDSHTAPELCCYCCLFVCFYTYIVCVRIAERGGSLELLLSYLFPAPTCIPRL